MTPNQVRALDLKRQRELAAALQPGCARGVLFALPFAIILDVAIVVALWRFL